MATQIWGRAISFSAPDILIASDLPTSAGDVFSFSGNGGAASAAKLDSPIGLKA